MNDEHIVIAETSKRGFIAERRRRSVGWGTIARDLMAAGYTARDFYENPAAAPNSGTIHASLLIRWARRVGQP